MKKILLAALFSLVFVSSSWAGPYTKGYSYYRDPHHYGYYAYHQPCGSYYKQAYRTRRHKKIYCKAHRTYHRHPHSHGYGQIAAGGRGDGGYIDIRVGRRF